MVKTMKQRVEVVEVAGSYVEIDGERYYRIANSHCMPEFMMSLVGASDHWMFISSAGALTAGRCNPDIALFPYAADDQISAAIRSTGSFTRLRLREHDGVDMEPTVWEPFTAEIRSDGIVRNLYKSPLGNKLVIEEVNEEFQMAIRYQWAFSERFGFVRSCRLENIGSSKCDFEILDGLQNLLPYGLTSEFMMRFSNLANAYKKSELLAESGLAIYYLSSIPTDRAEPCEGLKATTVWQIGLAPGATLLSTSQVERFYHGKPIENEVDIRGKAGAYLVHQASRLQAGESMSWKMVAELQQDHSDIVALDQWLRQSATIDEEVRADIETGERELLRIVSSSDGLQCGENIRRTDRHASNTIFNGMRGGVPLDGYQFPLADFLKHLRGFNVDVFERNRTRFQGLPERIDVRQLHALIDPSDDPDLIRLAQEYLPLAFSRRHGDPTRPWNRFAIHLRASSGETILNYQGNWRDIFQNWEALAASYPRFLTSMICRFVNATTADGYNPYRLTKDGFEWEKPEPHDPWSNIGYWGDHQIIYLLKLLEGNRKSDPDGLGRLLHQKIFTHANVPYRIKDFEQVKKDPCATIEYDYELDRAISERVARLGADGKLLCNRSGEIHRVTLFEKLLTLTLAKISNLVPDGGVWLNTQRPEWNDANNALVGNGLSVVTACYLYRWCSYIEDWLARVKVDSLLVSEEVAQLLQEVGSILDSSWGNVEARSNSRVGVMSALERREIVEALGNAGSRYRSCIYQDGPSGNYNQLDRSVCQSFFSNVRRRLEATIRHNRRDNGLYHAYNLLDWRKDGIFVEQLDEMLEGQVAVLSAGLLSMSEVLDLLRGLRSSKLFRENQNSYLLYPDRTLPRFLSKNRIDERVFRSSPLLQQLLADRNEEIIKRDGVGDLHFNGRFRNARDLKAALDSLPDSYQADVTTESEQLTAMFVETFGHRQFTGRSGTFFGYEGLGSIYWHMVSKLGLAVAENFFWGIDRGATAGQLEQLRNYYRDIRAGIGAEKTPGEYGAFPSDPYSHTPENAGVKQPGMTGQVKEDLLARLLELGLIVDSGCIRFRLDLFDRNELLTEPRIFQVAGLSGETISVTVPVNGFAYTYCQLPIVYKPDDADSITIHYKDGRQSKFEGLMLDHESSQHVFARTGQIRWIECGVHELMPESTPG